MSTEVLLKGFWVTIISLMFAWVVFSRNNMEKDSKIDEFDHQRYLPFISGSILPICILTLSLASLIIYGPQSAAKMTLSWCFGIFLHISLYYVILMLVLPFFRRYISARACAMLWMIPSYLYITQYSFMELPEPLLVIRAPGNLVWILFGIWLTGFVIVLLWKYISHLIFRNHILSAAVDVTDQEILEVWNKEIELANIKDPKFKLVVSKNVATPLSVGLYGRTTRVVLPARNYTNEQLSLIFRHEIIHIGREDAWSKFFLIFCTAMCWFNPLMWIAMRKSADDLELSCDETVLLDSDESIRRQYANLILNTAGDERGFTTCLSASASALRYRLKNIMKPKKRYSGALTVGLTFFILCMSCGYVALAYDGSTGADLIYQSKDTSLYTLKDIRLVDDSYDTAFECTDLEAFHEYMAGLTMDNLTGNYSFTGEEKQFSFLYDAPEGTFSVILSDHVIKIFPHYGEDRAPSYYYLSEGVDWEYLDTVIEAYPALNVYLTEPGDSYGKDISATLYTIWKTKDSESKVVYESDPLIESPSGMFGYEAEEIILSFSSEQVLDYSVKIESWDRQSSYIVSQAELEQPYVIPLPDYAAHYTVYASFVGRDNDIYETEFRFDIGDVGDG